MSTPFAAIGSLGLYLLYVRLEESVVPVQRTVSHLHLHPSPAQQTPPGWWHSHHNESDDVAWVLPIQDAGLYTHQRTLDIRFVDDELALHSAGRIRGSAFAVTDKQLTELHALGGLEPNKARVKRVLSAECLQTHKRRKSLQIGKEVKDMGEAVLKEAETGAAEA